MSDLNEHLVQLDFQRSLLKLNKWAENYFCECLAKSAVFSKLLRTRFRPIYRLFLVIVGLYIVSNLSAMYTNVSISHQINKSKRLFQVPFPRKRDVQDRVFFDQKYFQHQFDQLYLAK